MVPRGFAFPSGVYSVNIDKYTNRSHFFVLTKLLFCENTLKKIFHLIMYFFEFNKNLK